MRSTPVLAGRWLVACGTVAVVPMLGLLLLVPAAATRVGDAGGAAGTLPAQIGARDFWRLIVDLSEPNGTFRFSDNLTSNELGYQDVIPELDDRARRVPPGGAYLGVGPEQNFTYIAAVRPAIAVIVDIRRGNLQLQLMYKALFELARDRAEFVSLLFSKPLPAGVSGRSSVDDLFRAFAPVPADRSLFDRSLAAIDERLTKADGLPLDAEDLAGITHVFRAFYQNGFAVRYSPTYADLMTAEDGRGVQRSFLASEDGFGRLKTLETRNLVVPIVGDFAGSKALRGVGAYLADHHATVSTFYLSNVEQYLRQDGTWAAFCRNAAALPLAADSTFIRSSSRRGGWNGGGFGGGFLSSLGAMTAEASSCTGETR